MEIYYFGSNGQKIGPLTKEGLIRLAEAGIVTEQTAFEVNGKKVKGKHIKNLRPIFENRKRSESANPADSTDIQEETVLPPILETTPTDSANSSKSNEDFYKTSGVVFDSTDGKMGKPFNLKAQDPFRSRVRDISKRIEENEIRRQLRAYTKFRWCYRIIMILLLVGFLVTMSIFITGLVTGINLKNKGHDGYWILYAKIDGLIYAKTYQALGGALDNLSADSEHYYAYASYILSGNTQNNNSKPYSNGWETLEEIGISGTGFIEMWLDVAKSLNSYCSKLKIQIQGGNTDYMERGKLIDEVTKNKGLDELYSIEEMTRPAQRYWEYAKEKCERMKSEGAKQAEFYGKSICILIASYLAVLLPYFFMSAMVCAAEKNHRTMILLEESLKSKNKQ